MVSAADAGHTGGAMGTRNRRAARCDRCRQHASLCLCAELPRLDNRTRVLVVMHRAEDRKTTNTGRLAARCLASSTVLVRGDRDQEPLVLPLGDGSTPLLLFPHDDAEELGERHRALGPVTLVVPDGNWRQASRMRRRVAGLSSLACVRLPVGDPSRYRLRRNAREDNLSTLEAIARALAILEGPELGKSLEDVHRRSVDRMLWVRGDLADDEVHGGLPPGVMRHDPSPPPSCD